MINSVKITNYLGESITLELRNPESSGFFVQNIDGLGPAKGNISITETGVGDGGFYNSARQTTRNIVFKLGFYNNSVDSIETIRQKTYRFFPVKKPVTITVTTDNRVAYTTGYVETNEPDIFSNEESATISVICPSAFFYDENIQSVVFSGSAPAFEFPFENPSTTESLIEFGQVFIDTQKSVLYTGEEETGVMIYINILGDVTTPSIFNLTTGEAMTINSYWIITGPLGEDFHLGDQIVISTIRGSKYVHLIRDGVTYNILNALDAGADWFRIDRGDNLFTYTAQVGADKMQFRIDHRIVYGGL